MYQKKLEIDSHSFPELSEKVKVYAESTKDRAKNFLGKYFPLIHYQYAQDMPTYGNNLELLINGEEKFPRLFEDLRSAQTHIHLEYYIYEGDETGNEIADILIEKAKAGVSVRFLYDDFGSKALKKSFIKNLKSNGVEVVPFYKIRWLLFANGINYRNHRKIVVIDGKIGYIGGINISDRYDNTKKHDLFWRDTHVRVLGPAVLALQNYFLADWNFAAGQNIEFDREYFPPDKLESNEDGQLVGIIGSGPDSDQPSILYSMIQAISLSTEELLITTPYFIPDDSFIDALKIAKLSGVDVKILVPGVSDSFIVNGVANTYYTELIQLGIKIYRYNKGFVHAKTIICDRFVSMVGSANLDQRSFDLNFEINAIVYDNDFANKLRNQFFIDLEDATIITKEEWENRSIIKVLFERTARLLSPLM